MGVKLSTIFPLAWRQLCPWWVQYSYSSLGDMSLRCWPHAPSHLPLSRHYSFCLWCRILPLWTLFLERIQIFRRESLWSALLWGHSEMSPWTFFWFGGTTLVVALMKRERCPLNNFVGNHHMLNKLLVNIFMCLLEAIWCTSFFTSSW